MQNPATELESILSVEFARISELEGLAGSAVVNIIREVDYVYLYLRGSNQFTPRYTNFFETVHQYGWPLLLRAWYPLIDRALVHPVTESTYDLTGWADSLIHASGQVARCRQLLMFCEMGFGALTRTSETVFVFNIIAPTANTEAYDLLDFKYVQQEIIEKDIRRKKLRDNFNSALVQKRINASVHRPHGTSITYHATGYVTDYYIRQGHYHLQRLQLHDDFGPTDLFESIPYSEYVKMLDYLAGLALMHKAFCEAAYKKFGSFELRNILSLFCPKESVSADLARYLARPLAQATRMLAHVTLSHDNYQQYLSIPSAPPSPFVQLSESQFLRSTAGCLNNPYFFLNYELKRTCLSDYSRVVNNREVRFRQMVYTLFPEDRFVCVPNEVKFSTAVGKKPDTDIDAIVFDKLTKTLGLFQLKWQDPFAHSMQKRRSVVSNLQRNALSWLEKVLAWLDRNEPKTLLNALQVTRHSRTENVIGDVRIFVLGRRSIHFTGVEQDERAAWGSWPQVLAGTARAEHLANSSDPIKSLYDRLKFDSPKLRMEREGPLLPAKFELKVGRHRVSYE